MGPPLDRGGRIAIHVSDAIDRHFASMGPPLDRGGRPAFVMRYRRTRPVLQWGHRSIAVEGLACGRRRGRAFRASMGPPLDRGGRAQRISGRRLVSVAASMGPPLDRGGRRAVERLQRGNHGASMGPPLDRGGRVPVNGTPRLPPDRCNGATARSRWKGCRPFAR